MTEHINATVLDASGNLLASGLTLTDGVVTALDPVVMKTADAIAAAASSPNIKFTGFVQIRCHGGAGVSFPDDLDQDSIARAAERHARGGTLTLIASLVSAHDPLPAVRALAEACARGMIAGIQLEGPYISHDKCGAHDPAAIRPIDVAELEEILAAGNGWIRAMTIAPELEGADAAAAILLRNGARPSWGHTNASSEVTRTRIANTLVTAAELGVAHPPQTVTHLFNAMPPLHHRVPGPVLEFIAAARRGEAVVELIGDGAHLDLGLVRELLETLDEAGGAALITDAMAAAGMPDGEYQLGSLAVTVTGGTAYLTGTDTIAGGTSVLGEQVTKLLGSGITPQVLARAVCGTPARALGLPTPEPATVGRALSGVLVTGTSIRVWREGRELKA